MPSRSSSSLASCSREAALRHSDKVATIGNMIFIFPNALARRIARSWVLNSSGSSRQIRMAL